MGPWVDRAAMAAGVVVGVAFGQGVAAVASAGSLWQVELPLVVGGIAALLVWIRTKRHVLQAAALGFLCACAVVALLFLGAT